MKRVRFGIIGVGNIGGSHATRFLDNEVPGGELVALCDLNPKKLERFPGIRGWSNSSELIRSGEIDAVLICTPHYSHIPIGIEALETGLHVLCEKPLGVHVADCRRILAAHTNSQQIFGVMFDTRTEPKYQKVREMVRNGELGRIRRINWILTSWFRSDAYYRSSDWRATWDGEGGGMLVNQLPHDLDLFQWIFGLPKRVRAFCPLGKYHDIEVEDEVNAILEFEDGATGMIVATTGEAPGTDRREIVGTKGRLVIHADHLELTRTQIPVDEYCRTTDKSFGGPESETIRIDLEGKAGRHAEVLRRFVGAIHDETTLVAKASEAEASAALANAIIYSSWTDQTVELPLDPEKFESELNRYRENSRFVPNPLAEQTGIVDMAASFSH